VYSRPQNKQSPLVRIQIITTRMNKANASIEDEYDSDESSTSDCSYTTDESSVSASHEESASQSTDQMHKDITFLNKIVSSGQTVDIRLYRTGKLIDGKKKSGVIVTAPSSVFSNMTTLATVVEHKKTSLL